MGKTDPQDITVDPDYLSMIGCKSHYYDSGSFSWLVVAEKWAKDTGRTVREFFQSPKFTRSMDDYAAFIKKYAYAIDLYSNMDVIYDPVLSWDNQQYLEDIHGLHPVPVVHFKTDLKWLWHYVNRDYPIIALGGLVRASKRGAYYKWLDKLFTAICGKDGKPTVKLHGFGITNYNIMIRYPWWSIDSSAWTKRAGFGLVIIPHRRNGKYVFDENPYQLFFSSETPAHNMKEGKHFDTVSKLEQLNILEWFYQIDVPMGDDNSPGIVNCHNTRKIANLIFFDRMQKSLPDWPNQTFRPPRRVGFGIGG